MPTLYKKVLSLVNTQTPYWSIFVYHLTYNIPILYTASMTKKRIVITLTDEMHEAIKEVAARYGATQSGLIRAVMGQYLEEQGRPVAWLVEWGGGRRAGDTPQPDATRRRSSVTRRP